MRVFRQAKKVDNLRFEDPAQSLAHAITIARKGLALQIFSRHKKVTGPA
jgi:hypothetical protein